MGIQSKASGFVLITAAVMLSSSCVTTPARELSDDTTTSSVTSSPFPFPPVKTEWNAAVPLTSQQQAAADAALRMTILVGDWRPISDPTIPLEILRLVSPDQKPVFMPIGTVAETGGETYRVVAVREISPSRWDFDVCRYDTPGVYSMSTTGQLQLSTPHIVYAADSLTVSLTTEPNGAGETSDSPRFLVVDSQPIINDMARQTCEPYRPEPYIQQPPEPVSSGK
ncbi:hypothetical protein DFR75_1011926 [Nocardia ignorata]|uniref:Lipoprotein n=1 Tax=Nocardia ignorata TaxID=145285 RepID=A0A4R6PVB2_NOCIG|nr:hypothetical protein DFR75_1011926 [Nocardia ignorata]